MQHNNPKMRRCFIALAAIGLLLGSLGPAYGRYALEDLDLSGTSAAEWGLLLGGLFLLAFLGWVVLPCLLGWATYKVLQKRHPTYSAKALPSIALACGASWVGPWLLPYLLWSFFGYAYDLLLPIAGAALGYYACRQPLPLADELPN